MNYAIAVALLLLLGLFTLVSYVDRVYAEIGKFLSREFQNNIEAFEQIVEPRLGVGRQRAALSMAVLTQLVMAAIAMLVAFAVFKDQGWHLYEVLQATLSLILIVIVFHRFLPFLFFSRTQGRWLTRWVLLLRISIYLVLPVTLVLGFLQSVTALTREHVDESPESTSEGVEALIEAGEEEGILDESNRELIHSVVQFGELQRDRPFSRVPVFDGTIHNVVGIVYTQDVLQVPDSEAGIRTVATVMRTDVYFVPESKLGSELLREMRKNNIRMAIVVDEYGGVAGLVTIEDLVEEIVGEIRDEHEKAEVVRENDRSYIVAGNVDIDRLAELFGVRPEGKESATVAGLVTELAGRIPQKGEVVEDDGLRFEVLDSTERRVERVRISTPKPTP